MLPKIPYVGGSKNANDTNNLVGCCEYAALFLVGRNYNLRNEAFQLAENNGVKCVLDTDSKLKADKYQHVGMKLVKEQELESGIHMYTLERKPIMTNVPSA